MPSMTNEQYNQKIEILRALRIESQRTARTPRNPLTFGIAIARIVAECHDHLKCLRAFAALKSGHVQDAINAHVATQQAALDDAMEVSHD